MLFQQFTIRMNIMQAEHTSAIIFRFHKSFAAPFTNRIKFQQNQISPNNKRNAGTFYRILEFNSHNSFFRISIFLNGLK